MARTENISTGVIISEYTNSKRGSRERGRINEQRAYKLAQVLVQEGLLKKVSRASRKQDRKGVDFWVYPMSHSEGFRVPFQIKSSALQAISFRKKDSNPNRIAVVVVNENLSDQEIKQKIIVNMAVWISRNVRKAGMAEVVNAPV